MSDDGRRNDLSLNDLRRLHHQMPRWVMVLIIVGAAVLVASHVAHLVITLIVSALAAYILSSAVMALEVLGVRRSMAVILLFLLAVVLAAAAHLIFAPYLMQEITNGYARLPEFSKQIETALLSGAHDSARRSPVVGQVIGKLVDTLIGPNGFLEKALDITGIMTQATPFIMGVILVPFFTFFLLKDWPRAMKKIIDWVPASYVETTLSVIAEMNILIGKYLRGLAGDCFAMGMLASLGLWLIGISNPISLGIVTGLANVIPYLGPIIACAVASLIALMQFNSFDAVLNVVILYIVIKLTDDLLIQPLLIGKSVELHPMLLVVTIIVGENLFGISGMILGVPVVTAVQKTVSILFEHRRETSRRESAGGTLSSRFQRAPVRPI